MQKRVQPSHQVPDEGQSVDFLRNQLRATLDAMVLEKRLSQRDKRILLLRLGLEGGKCHTLNEVAALLDKSPELVRSRQYLALKKNIRDVNFCKLLRDYDCMVKLPRGVTYYLYRDSENHKYSAPPKHP